MCSGLVEKMEFSLASFKILQNEIIPLDEVRKSDRVCYICLSVMLLEENSVHRYQVLFTAWFLGYMRFISAGGW